MSVWFWRQEHYTAKFVKRYSVQHLKKSDIKPFKVIFQQNKEQLNLLVNRSKQLQLSLTKLNSVPKIKMSHIIKEVYCSFQRFKCCKDWKNPASLRKSRSATIKAAGPEFSSTNKILTQFIIMVNVRNKPWKKTTQRISENLMQHMQDVLLPFFSNNIFRSFCNAGNIKPGFKAIKTKKEKRSSLIHSYYSSLFKYTILLLSYDLRKTKH